MCDPGFILGIASGAASAIGEAEAADANMDQSIRQAKLEHAAQEQERLIQGKRCAAGTLNSQPYQHAIAARVFCKDHA